jgi:hypothetical protein
VKSNIRRRFGVRISASRAGSQQLDSFSSELREALFAAHRRGRGLPRGLRCLSHTKLRSKGCSPHCNGLIDLIVPALGAP